MSITKNADSAKANSEQFRSPASSYNADLSMMISLLLTLSSELAGDLSWT